MKATEKQIAEWKKANPNGIFELTVGDKSAYLKKPDRKVISMATSLGSTDPVHIAELIMDACWLGGDEEIRKDDDYFMSAMNKLQDMVDLKEADLKKI
jgi:hypothetical protein